MLQPRVEALESRWMPTTVTNLDDAGPGSLRQALLDTLAGGTVDFQPGLSGTITLTTGQLTIDKSLTIAGPGANVLTVSGNNASRVFEVLPAVTVTLAAMTIANGRVTGANAQGGGIYTAGTLTVLDSIIINNSATGSGLGSTISAYGGGIYNSPGAGTLLVTRATFSNNIAAASVGYRQGSARSFGGGIYNATGAALLTVTDSTFSGNRATASAAAWSSSTAEGGGIVNAGPLAVLNSTFSGNSASASGPGGHAARGGGLSNSGTLTVAGSTLTSNSVSGQSLGGGIYGSITVLRNTIIAGNSGSPQRDVSGIIGSQGHNLIGVGDGGSGYHETDLVGSNAKPIDPLLGPLGDYGGSTFTHALLPGSLAIDAGDNTDATEFDQRGFTRIANSTIDIGAFEVQAPLPPGAVIITQGAFRNQGPVGSLRVTFDRPIDAASFTPEDVFYFEGPLGFVEVLGVAAVPGSGDRQFEITFPAQTVTGIYGLHIGPHILDLAGDPMNQTPDELLGWSDDYFMAAFAIEGPRVLSSTPSGTVGGPVERVRLTFSLPIDPASFEAADLYYWVGPQGAVEVDRVEAVPGSGNTQFDLVPRGSLTAVGQYWLALWPDVRDFWGNPLDQNDNFIAGEGLEDGYAATFEIAGAGPSGAGGLGEHLAAVLAALVDAIGEQRTARKLTGGVS